MVSRPVTLQVVSSTSNALACLYPKCSSPLVLKAQLQCQLPWAGRASPEASSCMLLQPVYMCPAFLPDDRQSESGSLNSATYTLHDLEQPLWLCEAQLPQIGKEECKKKLDRVDVSYAQPLASLPSTNGNSLFFGEDGDHFLLLKPSAFLVIGIQYIFVNWINKCIIEWINEQTYALYNDISILFCLSHKYPSGMFF